MTPSSQEIIFIAFSNDFSISLTPFLIADIKFNLILLVKKYSPKEFYKVHSTAYFETFWVQNFPFPS